MTSYEVVEPGGDLAAASARLTVRGWRPHRLTAVPAEPWDLAAHRVAVVADLGTPADAEAALLAAVRGAALAVRLDRSAPWAAGFLADLDRVRAQAGTVDAPSTQSDPLTDEQRQLLDLLADGTSIAQAARRLFLSLRTANRRVAEAREAFGVATTREAVLAYIKLRDA